MKIEIPGYAMATKAIHKMGDISSDEPDLCYLHKETDNDYVGNWVTGFGFVDVEFPKTTTRALTSDEIKKYNNTHIQLANYPPVKLNVGQEVDNED